MVSHALHTDPLSLKSIDSSVMHLLASFPGAQKMGEEHLVSTVAQLGNLSYWGEPERAPHYCDFIAQLRVYICLD